MNTLTFWFVIVSSLVIGVHSISVVGDGHRSTVEVLDNVEFLEYEETSGNVYLSFNGESTESTILLDNRKALNRLLANLRRLTSFEGLRKTSVLIRGRNSDGGNSISITPLTDKFILCTGNYDNKCVSIRKSRMSSILDNLEG